MKKGPGSFQAKSCSNLFTPPASRILNTLMLFKAWSHCICSRLQRGDSRCTTRCTTICLKSYHCISLLYFDTASGEAIPGKQRVFSKHLVKCVCTPGETVSTTIFKSIYNQDVSHLMRGNFRYATIDSKQCMTKMYRTSGETISGTRF